MVLELTLQVRLASDVPGPLCVPSALGSQGGGDRTGLALPTWQLTCSPGHTLHWERVKGTAVLACSAACVSQTGEVRPGFSDRNLSPAPFPKPAEVCQHRGQPRWVLPGHVTGQGAPLLWFPRCLIPTENEKHVYLSGLGPGKNSSDRWAALQEFLLPPKSDISILKRRRRSPRSTERHGGPLLRTLPTDPRVSEIRSFLCSHWASKQARPGRAERCQRGHGLAGAVEVLCEQCIVGAQDYRSTQTNVAEAGLMAWWSMRLIPAPEGQRQEGLRVRGQPGLQSKSRTVGATQRNPVSKKPNQTKPNQNKE
ncbi:uncharacterized protein LOC129679652 [Psammomys obesus]|uniref:uncharacterized protein LOC129679652 n=1 Tax=Psammomys obesus TaxID=48139 RepID=UPI00245365E0|nr:uncharacterized protein LOC129679652 [Psammomys obesus]